MSRVLPILFNGDMVRAILDGRKTVTRRLAKKIPTETHRIEEIEIPQPFYGDTIKQFECHWGGYQPDTGGFVDGSCKVKPPYQPGDILYVRETWCYGSNTTEILFEPEPRAYDILYKADYKYLDKDMVKWHPSIHMPKEAARIFLKVANVRVEQLQDITHTQACMEGVGNLFLETIAYTEKHYDIPFNQDEGLEKEQFAYLWDSTIKKADLSAFGWDTNPWVWVIEFERCEKPESEVHN